MLYWSGKGVADLMLGQIWEHGETSRLIWYYMTYISCLSCSLITMWMDEKWAAYLISLFFFPPLSLSFHAHLHCILNTTPPHITQKHMAITPNVPSHLESIALHLTETKPAATKPTLHKVPSQELRAHAMTTAQLMRELGECIGGKRGKEVRRIVRNMKSEQVIRDVISKKCQHTHLFFIASSRTWFVSTAQQILRWCSS